MSKFIPGVRNISRDLVLGSKQNPTCSKWSFYNLNEEEIKMILKTWL